MEQEKPNQAPQEDPAQAAAQLPNESEIANNHFMDKLNQIMQRRNLSKKKAQQRMRHSNIRKAARQFGKMDQVSTRSQTQGSQQAYKVGLHENLKAHINQSEGRIHMETNKGDKNMDTQHKKEEINNV